MTVENINKARRSDSVKIMVVDDSDLSRRSIVEILEKEGFTVAGQASSAEAALQQAYSTGANVFLIDIVMPETSGLELGQLIKENIKDPKMIMMSSLDLDSIVIDSISSGAIDFLSKPFTPEDLIKSIEKVEIEIEKELA